MKFLRWLLLVPVALLAIVIAIANRQPVTFSLDPFDPLHPALGFTMPLALIVILAMFVGMLIGGAASWRQARVRSARRSSPILPPAAPTTSLPVAQD